MTQRHSDDAGRAPTGTVRQMLNKSSIVTLHYIIGNRNAALKNLLKVVEVRSILLPLLLINNKSAL